MGKTRVFIVASAGGHWEQMMLLRSAFQGCETRFCTTMAGMARRSGVPAIIVRDCNRDTPLDIVAATLQIGWSLLRFRPHVVVSTGALPGLIAIIIGKRMGARTLWIDSIANVNELSLGGKKAKDVADKCVSQWPDLARDEGLEYWGRVL